MKPSHGAEHFRHIYARSEDPWAFRTSAYEQAKYCHTMTALEERRFRRGFEPGCSIGVLTRMLAEHCDELLAADIVDEPLQAARSACADMPWVHFRQLTIPRQWPDGCFDLIVLSEVLYFLSASDIAGVAARVISSLDRDGLVLLVNWLGEGNDPCSGDAAAGLFLENTHKELRVASQARTASYRLDVLMPR